MPFFTKLLFTRDTALEILKLIKPFQKKDISSLYFDRRPRAIRNQEANNLLGGK